MTPSKRKDKKGENEDPSSLMSINSLSETTIYHDTVPKEPKQQEANVNIDKVNGDNETQSIGDPDITFKKRDSSTSEEQVEDTSDELLDVDTFIADCEASAKRYQDE